MDGTVQVTLSQLILTIAGTVLGSSGLFAFIQFMISRKDKKDDKLKEVQKSIQNLEAKNIEREAKLHDAIDALDKRNSMQDDNLKQTINSLINKIDRNHVIEARIRILRANDEIRQGVHHSYEYFRQLHQDITEYEKYCVEHPEFKNNEAVNSIEYINRIYQECLDSNSFLT